MSDEIILIPDPNSRPLNSRKKWETDEEEIILEMLKANKSIDEIALKLERSRYSIRLRLDTLAVRAINNGKTIEEVARLTNFNETYINDCIIRCELADKRKKINEDTYKDISNLKAEFERMHNEINALHEKLEPLSDIVKKLNGHEAYIKLFVKQIKLLQQKE